MPPHWSQQRWTTSLPRVRCAPPTWVGTTAPRKLAMPSCALHLNWGVSFPSIVPLLTFNLSSGSEQGRSSYKPETLGSERSSVLNSEAQQFSKRTGPKWSTHFGPGGTYSSSEREPDRELLVGRRPDVFLVKHHRSEIGSPIIHIVVGHGSVAVAVHYVEETTLKLHVHALADTEVFHEREVPLARVHTAKVVAPCVAEGAKSRNREGIRIHQAQWTRMESRRRRVAHDFSTFCVSIGAEAGIALIPAHDRRPGTA